ARIPFLANEPPLAPARIDEQPQRQRQIAFLREVPDRLRTPILIQQKLIFGQIAYDFALFVADIRKDVDYLDVRRKRRSRLLLLTSQKWRNSHCREQTPPCQPSIVPHLGRLMQPHSPGLRAATTK